MEIILGLLVIGGAAWWYFSRNPLAKEVKETLVTPQKDEVPYKVEVTAAPVVEDVVEQAPVIEEAPVVEAAPVKAPAKKAKAPKKTAGEKPAAKKAKPAAKTAKPKAKKA